MTPSRMIEEPTAPYNVEAEQGALGSMLLDNATIDEVAALVSADDFFREDHQIIFRAILEARDLNGGQVDAILLHDVLARTHEARRFADHRIVFEILEATPHAAHATMYAGIVRDKSISRGLIEAANRILRENYSHQHTAAELVESAERAIFAVGDRHDPAASAELADAVAEADAAIGRRAGGEITGVGSGLRDLDDVTGGFAPGSLTIVAGRPSMGKTAFVLGICENATMGLLRPFLVSLEMGRVEIGQRMLASRSGVDGYKLRNAWKLTPGERAALDRARHELIQNSFPVDDASTRTVAQIASSARRHKARRDIGLLVVDYLQLIDPGDSRDSRQEQISKISRRLKTLARELGIPVIALSQLNRGVEQREDKRPRMSDLRDSGAIEQDADLVILIHRPEFYDPNDKPGVAEIIVDKNRNGATATIQTNFHKGITRFESVQKPQNAQSFDVYGDDF